MLFHLFLLAFCLVFASAEVSIEGKVILSLHKEHHHRITEVVEEIHALLPKGSQARVNKVWPLLGKVSLHNVEFEKDILRSHEAIRKVHAVQLLKASEYSWGIDRIDQTYLPLDGVYDPTYTGANVDAYILDTGLDTLHVEFNNTDERTVTNFYAGYGELSPNTDGNGHGTHCAGTIGGRTVGVSPHANIYAGKVLSDEGYGDTEIIVDGLNAVYNHSLSSPNRALISMSLGGPCEDGFCVDDPIVDTIDNFITPAGITVIVAAGNEACDACYTSPGGAETTITVGATDINDDFAWFSNWGDCVDILGPGVNIVSACSMKIYDECTYKNGDEDSYWTISGTSMACPHVAGTVAQWLEKDNTLTPSGVREALQCGAVNGTIAEVFGNDPTKNFMLQVPRENSSATCDLGAGCASDCSGNGACNVGSSGCDCNKGWTGDTCSEVEEKIITCDGNQEIYGAMYMISDSGDGWGSGSVYTLRDETDNSVVYQSTLECGYALPDQFCFNETHEYSLRFSETDDFGFWAVEPCSTDALQVNKNFAFYFSFENSVCTQTANRISGEGDDDEGIDSLTLTLAIAIPVAVILIAGTAFYYRKHLQSISQARHDGLAQDLLD